MFSFLRKVQCRIKQTAINVSLFCRSDRVTVQEREKMELDLERKEEEKKKVHEERTKTSRKVISENRKNFLGCRWECGCVYMYM